MLAVVKIGPFSGIPRLSLRSGRRKLRRSPIPAPGGDMQAAPGELAELIRGVSFQPQAWMCSPGT